MLVICSIALATFAMTADAPSMPDDQVRREYRQVEAGAGRTPLDHVRLALWCESHGLGAERARHLALAVLADPTNAVARGLLGLVAREGRWVAPDLVARSIRQDADRSSLLAEYDARRSKAAYKADDQAALAAWAEQRGLHDQARAHLVAVTRIDPSRESAWKKLGYKKLGKGWATDEQLAASKLEADAQKAADRKWKPLLEGWKDQLGRPDRREAARTALLGVTDPRSVPSIVRVFVTRNLDDQQEAVGLLGQVAGPEASRVLAGLAVRSKSAEVRRAAVETLRRRDPRDFVHLWVAMVRSPIKFEVQPASSPGQTGSLYVEGKRSNTRRVYGADIPPLTIPALMNETLSYDKNGLPVVSGALGYWNDPSRRMSPRTFFEVMSSAESFVSLDDAAFIIPTLGPSPADPAMAQAFLDQLGGRSPAGRAFADRLGREAGGATSSPRDFDPNFAASYLGFGFANAYDPALIGRNRVVLRDGMGGGSYSPTFTANVSMPIGQMMADASRAASTARAQLDRDVKALDAVNRDVREQNEPVLVALRSVTGKDLGDDGPAWTKWWTDQLGYAQAADNSAAVPTITETVPTGYTPTARPVVSYQLVGGQWHHSCFAAGTEVRTADGSRPIETIKRGDLVLTQDTRTGALGYRAVLTAFHNPPSPTYRVRLEGGEAVEATGIHRFWLAGNGWKMARDLAPGDTLRVLGGAARVEGVDPIETPRPVFNLEVADASSFFVGKLGALVHDNSQVEATPDPFDAPTRPEAAAPGTPRR